jgi:hypothetical protein
MIQISSLAKKRGVVQGLLLIVAGLLSFVLIVYQLFIWASTFFAKFWLVYPLV